MKHQGMSNGLSPHHALSETAHPCAIVEIPAFRARQKVGVADEDAADAAALEAFLCLFPAAAQGMYDIRLAIDRAEREHHMAGAKEETRGRRGEKRFGSLCGREIIERRVKDVWRGIFRAAPTHPECRSLSPRTVRRILCIAQMGTRPQKCLFLLISVARQLDADRAIDVGDER